MPRIFIFAIRAPCGQRAEVHVTAALLAAGGWEPISKKILELTEAHVQECETCKPPRKEEA